MQYTWSLEGYNYDMKRTTVEDYHETRHEAVIAAFDLFEADSDLMEVWIYERDNVTGEWGEKFTISKD